MTAFAWPLKGYCKLKEFVIYTSAEDLRARKGQACGVFWSMTKSGDHMATSIKIEHLRCHMCQSSCMVVRRGV